MFHLDDSFLAEHGLGGMHPQERRSLLAALYETLEYSVGVVLSEGMSDAQLDEFSAIVDRRHDVVRRWVTTNAPDYREDPLWAQQVKDSPEQEDIDVLASYAATKWLEVNRPDYREVVRAVLQQLGEDLDRRAAEALSISRQVVELSGAPEGTTRETPVHTGGDVPA